MKTLAIFGIIADILYMLVIVDLFYHFDKNQRRAYIRRVLKARQEIQDNYGTDAPGGRHVKVEELDEHSRRGSRQDRREKDLDHESWISDLTTHERALIDLYSDETVKIRLPAQEVM